jgi:hypothetical protein
MGKLFFWWEMDRADMLHDAAYAWLGQTLKNKLETKSKLTQTEEM